MKKKLSLNELPKWSLWPARVLAQAPWKIPDRTEQKVFREYDKDKYGDCLAYFKKNGAKLSVNEVKEHEEGSFDQKVCISEGNELFETTLGEAREMQYAWYAKTMAPAIKKSATVLELGAGYGVNLANLKGRIPTKAVWRGGELSVNAVKLARELYKNEPGISVDAFNFFDTKHPVLEKAEGPVTVFTSHALEQLPESKSFVKGIMKYRDRIDRVFHFEPVYESHDDSLLGLMRKRYAEINDYNHDLLTELKKQSKHIRIIRVEPDVLGLYPLNSTTLIEWEFIK